MSITEELNQLIAEHGSARDALNVTLAKLRHVQSEIAVLKEAAEQSMHPTGGNCAECGELQVVIDGCCINCGTSATSG